MCTWTQNYTLSACLAPLVLAALGAPHVAHARGSDSVIYLVHLPVQSNGDGMLLNVAGTGGQVTYPHAEVCVWPTEFGSECASIPVPIRHLNATQYDLSLSDVASAIQSNLPDEDVYSVTFSVVVGDLDGVYAKQFYDHLTDSEGSQRFQLAEEILDDEGMYSYELHFDLSCNPDSDWTWYPDNDGDGDGDVAGTCSVMHPQTASKMRRQFADDGIGTDLSPNMDDKNDDDVLLNSRTRWYPDVDGDGYGDDSSIIGVGFNRPEGATSYGGDCDDNADIIHPFADDALDDIDQDCGGTTAPDPQITSDMSFSTLQNIINAAVPGSTIFVEPSIYLMAQPLKLPNGVTLRGLGDPRETVFDAKGKGRVMVFNSGQGSDTVISRITISGGVATSTDTSLVNYEGRGGNILIIGSSPTFTDVIIKDGLASYTGGGIYAETSRSLFTRVTLSHNGTEMYGGGAALVNTAVRFEDSTIELNYAVSATMDTTAGGLTITNTLSPTEAPSFIGTSFIDNWAYSPHRSYGGAIHVDFVYMNQDPVTFENCHIERNSAVYWGGGIKTTRYAKLSITNSTLSWNRTTGTGGNPSGGAIYLWGSSILTCDNCLFEGNIALRFGGAISAAASLSGGGMWLVDSTFKNNGRGVLPTDLPTAVGGAIAGFTISAIDCDFIGNSADQGGAIYTVGPTTVQGCNFEGNTATSQGSTFYVDGAQGGQLSFWDSFVRDHTTSTISSIFVPSNTSVGVALPSVSGLDICEGPTAARNALLQISSNGSDINNALTDTVNCPDTAP